VLATGDWYRIEIRDNGDGKSDAIYKMSKSFLEGAGINLSSVDPRTIKMYGNGGELLPEGLEEPRPQDLIQIPIFIYGENDGHFDTQDYVLFYGKSIHNWRYDQNAHCRHISIITIHYYWMNTRHKTNDLQPRKMCNIQ
jgi:hypothetical protein